MTAAFSLLPAPLCFTDNASVSVADKRWTSLHWSCFKLFKACTRHVADTHCFQDELH